MIAIFAQKAIQVIQKIVIKIALGFVLVMDFMMLAMFAMGIIYLALMKFLDTDQLIFMPS